MGRLSGRSSNNSHFATRPTSYFRLKLRALTKQCSTKYLKCLFELLLLMQEPLLQPVRQADRIDEKGVRVYRG